MSAVLSQINIQLVIVGIAITTSTILGVVVYLNDRRSITNITFLFFSLSAVLWNICNYLFYQPNHNPELALLLLRLVVFFAIWYCFFLSQLFYVFPSEKIIFKAVYYRILLPAVTFVSALTLTPVVFKSVTSFDVTGRVATVSNGLGIYLFGFTVVVIVISGFYLLISKIFKLNDQNVNKEQLSYIFTGAVITFSLHIVFNMILPAFFNISQFTALGAIFTLPFSIFTSFAIIKYRLFNVKVIATQLATFSLWVILLIRTLTSINIIDLLINSGLLAATIIIGILLIRSVLQEVGQRERLEILTEALEEANDKLKDLDKLKTEFLSLASHQLRSPLTAIKGYTSMLLEGSFGEVKDPKQKEAIDRVFQSSNHLAKVVEDLLNVTKIEQGGMKYEIASFDFGKAVSDLATDLSVTAEKKGLKLTYTDDGTKPYTVSGDMEKIRQVILNLIDNSIKYTAQGWIKVEMKRNTPTTVLFSVSDSGMGVTPEIIKTLFQKFARGEGGKVNTSGSGLGLYLAKQIVEAHKGRVWVESAGKEKGSTFFVELKLA